MSSSKSKRRCISGQKYVLAIDLDAITDEEATDEEETKMSGLSDNESHKSKEEKIVLKKKSLLDMKNDIIRVSTSLQRSSEWVDSLSSLFEDNTIEKKGVKDVKKNTKTCNKDIEKTLKKDINKDNKELKTSKEDIKDVIKPELKRKVLEQSFSQMPSTSRKEPKTEIIDRKTDEIVDHLPQKSVQMRDQSTDTRFHIRSFSLDIEKLPSISDQNTTAATAIQTITTIPPKIWAYICLNCSQRVDSKKQFIKHFDENHPKILDLAKKYKKFEEKDISSDKNLISVQQKSSEDNTLKQRLHRSQKRGHNSSSLLSPSVPSTHRSSESSHSSNVEQNESKHKRRRRLKSSATAPNPTSSLSPNSVSFGGGEGMPSPQALMTNHYRLVQKCKICSFMPLINSMQAIEEHVEREHDIRIGVNEYYSAVMVKMAPKKTAKS